MSWYKNFIILLLPLLFVACVNDKNLQISNKKLFEKEDQYILFALEYEKANNLSEARKLYLKLFENSHRDEYLIRFLMLSMKLKKFEDVKKYSYKYLDEKSASYEDILRFYTISLLKLDKLNKALKNANILLNKFNNSKNYELLANIYFEKQEYKKAEEYFESAYISDINGKTLINLADVLYSYLNKKEKAISYLETHIRLYGCDGGVCNKLFSFYKEEKNINGIISVLKKAFYEYKKQNNLYSMNETYNLLISYLQKKNLDEAIKFLEDNNLDSYRLLFLYEKKQYNKKALSLLRKLYKSSGNIELLGQIAMLEFEVAKDKRKVLKKVITKFENALMVLDNHIYQNYLGYLLIDYGIDVDKGISLVKKALEKAPNNMAYMDSLAWGLYKKRECKKAYIYMKKVVDGVGFNDKDIKKHWNKIKECKAGDFR